MDGLPLAIELAAAWSNVLPPRRLLEQLDRRLALLVGGPRDAPTRQQTLHATIAWSDDLLATDAQAILRRLAVFAGSCTLPAVEAVCGDREALAALEAPGDAESPPETVLHGLAALVDASLLQPPSDGALWGEPGTEPRYSMLETVRDYAVERLRASGEADVMERRHAEFYLHLTESLQPWLWGPQQAAALVQLEDEHPNLRAALGWAIKQADIAGAMRMALALWQFWLVHCHLREGRQWLETVVTLVEQADAARELVPAADRATLLHVTGNLARAQGDYTRTVALFEAGLALRRSIGDVHGIGVSLHNLGAVAYEQGDYPQAARLNREALALMHQLNDPHGIAITLLDLGDALAGQGEEPGAAGSYAESLALFRDLEHTWGIARVLLRLGDLARRRGAPDAPKPASPKA